MVCSHDPFLRTNKESSIWRHANLSAPFIFQGECRMKIGHVLFPSVFQITDPCDGKPFLMCSHDPFSGTNKNRILQNGSCERAFS